MKNIPQRTCTVCRKQKNKNELLRIVKNKENIIKVDEIGKEPGRGAYICYDMECLEKAKLMTPVPGGVGPMTVISLMENVYETKKNEL